MVVQLDLPGVTADTIDVTVEKNTLTVRAERPRSVPDGIELIVGERPAGVFSRQLFLGDGLDTEHIEADYTAGELTLRVPVAENARRRKVEISTQDRAPTAIAG